MEGLLDVAQDVVAPAHQEGGHFPREVGGTVRGIHPRRLGSVIGGQSQSRRSHPPERGWFRWVSCPGNEAILRQLNDATRRGPKKN